MAAAAITITYDLSPPPGLDTQGLATHKTHTVPVPLDSAPNANGNNTESLKTYYAALRVAIAQAKETVGEELTAWRDVVGKAEVSKEPRARNEESDDEEEEEGEEA